MKNAGMARELIFVRFLFLLMFVIFIHSINPSSLLGEELPTVTYYRLLDDEEIVHWDTAHFNLADFDEVSAYFGNVSGDSILSAFMMLDQADSLNDDSLLKSITTCFPDMEPVGEHQKYWSWWINRVNYDGDSIPDYKLTSRSDGSMGWHEVRAAVRSDKSIIYQNFYGARRGYSNMFGSDMENHKKYTDFLIAYNDPGKNDTNAKAFIIIHQNLMKCDPPPDTVKKYLEMEREWWGSMADLIDFPVILHWTGSMFEIDKTKAKNFYDELLDITWDIDPRAICAWKQTIESIFEWESR